VVHGGGKEITSLHAQLGVALETVEGDMPSGYVTRVNTPVPLVRIQCPPCLAVQKERVLG